MIYAPEWVKEGLRIISSHIPPGIGFDIYDGKGSSKVGSLTIEGQISLQQLVMISRNEPENVTGIINFKNYEPNIVDKSVIYALKDLVRQCVIVGKDKTTHYGGYPRGSPIPQKDKVYIADLAGLQFQRSYNSGRLVLIDKNTPSGLLDELIYRSVVGENKRSFDEAAADASGRYVKLFSQNQYFDSTAYKKFVSNDLLLAGLALNDISENEEINFKFLKYGTGFFAGSSEMQVILDQYIIEGVREGIQILFASHNPKWIKSIELPFYDFDDQILAICKNHNVECKFSRDDALKKTHPQLVTATTNCADPHVVMGNEMGYSSVDAAISQNLESRGHIFSPCVNKLMGAQFIPLKPEICRL